MKPRKPADVRPELSLDLRSVLADETVTMELRKLIQQGRMAKKMSQKELATVSQPRENAVSHAVCECWAGR